MENTTDASDEESIIATRALELRIALDKLFEHEFQFLCLQDQLARFVLLVSQYEPEIIKRAVLMTLPDSDSGRLPIHLACDKNAPTQVICWLLDSDVNKESIQVPDKWGDLPLHTICSRNNVEVVQLLLSSDEEKTTLFIKDNQGSLPLHMACRYNADAQVIQLLLDSDTDKTSLFQEGMHGQLPVHVAARCNASLELVKLLLDHDKTKKSLLQEDSVGRLPIHVVLLRNPNLQVVKLLLEGMICHRMDLKGLELWKRDIYSILKSIKTHERDFNARDKLDTIGRALEDFMERAFLLELAIWRASCLGFNNDDASFESMQEIDDLGETLQAFDPDEYKRQAHIKSGAEIIIPGVIGFLEDEPVTKILREIE